MDLETQFSYFCRDGNLEGAQELLLKNPNINISASKEFAFRLACLNGHLIVAQWLLSIKSCINISFGNEHSFRYACENGRLEIAQCLQTFKPNLYVINYNEDGTYKDYYIRSKEEERWEQRKQLVWLASNESPCKNNIFYKIPEDVSRYIISCYL